MSVPIDPKDPLDTGHDYDGIREHDNKLPNWWLATLFIALVFGYGYWLYFQVMGDGRPLQAEYLASLDEASRASVARAKARGGLTDEALAALSSSPSVVQRGAATFTQSCASCHGAQGQGLIGPNLTDAYWIHGGRATDILKTVLGGVASKGMPSWEPMLGEERVEEVVAFVLTQRDHNIPGKAPQGELITALPLPTGNP